MLKIEIKEANLTGRKWKSGDPILEQHGWAFIPERNGSPAQYPQKITLRLSDGQEPYRVGLYQLEDQSMYVGNFGALTIGQAVLTPIQQAQKLASAA